MLHEIKLSRDKEKCNWSSRSAAQTHSLSTCMAQHSNVLERVWTRHQILYYSANSAVHILGLKKSYSCCAPYAEACHLLTVPSKDDPDTGNRACSNGCQTLSYLRHAEGGQQLHQGVGCAACMYHRSAPCSTANALSRRTYDRPRWWSSDVGVRREVPERAHIQGWDTGCFGCILVQHHRLEGFMAPRGMKRAV